MKTVRIRWIFEQPHRRENGILPSARALSDLYATFPDAKTEWFSPERCELLIETDREEEAERIAKSVVSDRERFGDVKTEIQTDPQASDDRKNRIEAERAHRFLADLAKNENEPSVSELIGADEFRDLIDEIKLIAPHVVRKGTQDAFLFQNYLFAINDGCGLSTCLNLFADVLESEHLIRFNPDRRVREFRLRLASAEREDPFAAVKSLLEKSDRDGVSHLICLDIGEFTSEPDEREFRRFLTVLEDYTDRNVFVFRIPFVEADVLEQIRQTLADVLFIRAVTFPPLSTDHLIACAKRFFTRYGYRAEDEIWDLFRARIAEEKSDGRFYGMNTVDKIVREAVYRKQLSDARRGTEDSRIRKEDIAGLTREWNGEKKSGEELLASLIGMERVKTAVYEIVEQIERARNAPNDRRPCVHMRFVGNPGTGKTTVARILGTILKERGLLRCGAFFEYAGRDFCGRYIGETAPKTAEMCRDAYGSVLFVDEAYSLCRDGDDRRDFGREALDTLLSEMENHRNDLVVVMAGYPHEMDEMMHANPGLESRMPYVIEFPNYTRDELYDIYRSMADGTECEEGFWKTVREFFNTLPDETLASAEFSNARFVRNLFERTCAKAAVRQKLSAEPKFILTSEDFTLAGSDRSLGSLIGRKPKNRIGF